MIGFEIGENGMGGPECPDVIGHETRNFEDDISALQSPFLDGLHRLRKRDLEISGEENLSFPVFLFQKVIYDPCGRGFPVCSGHGDDSEAFREGIIHEIQFPDNLSGLVYPVRWSDTWGRDYSVVFVEAFGSIRIIPDLSGDFMVLEKALQGISDFPFPIYEDFLLLRHS